MDSWLRSLYSVNTCINSLLVSRLSHRTYRVVVPPSLGEVIDEAQQGPGTANEGVQKVLPPLLPSYYCPRMKGDVQIHLSACPICDNYHNQTKGQRAVLNPIPSAPGDILAIDVFGGKTSIPTSERGNKYIFTMVDLSIRFDVAVPMPD